MKRLLFIVHCSLFIALAPAGAIDFPTGSGPGIMSQFGQIQNVQSYSSNPFYGPNSPYNQRLPVPVYVQGTELNAAECQSVLSSLVAQQCAMKNNCANAKVGDIRPGIMVMLSGLSGHNYVSACSGYLDGAFNDYVAQHSVMQGGAAFPTAANPGDNAPAPEFKIDNPYQIKSKGPWLDDIIQRTGELGKLQAQNAEDYNLKPTQMPTTIADVSFSDRMANAAAGYEQWAPVYKQVCDSAGKNCHQACVKNCAYQTMNIESDAAMYQRQASEAQAKMEARRAECEYKKMSLPKKQYCDECPGFDASYCGTQDANGGGSGSLDNCPDKLAELKRAEEALARLKECKRLNKSLADCYLPVSDGKGNIIPVSSNGSYASGIGSAVMGAGTIAAIIMTQKSAAAIKAAATQVPGTPAVAPTGFIPNATFTPAQMATMGVRQNAAGRYISTTPVNGVNNAYISNAEMALRAEQHGFGTPANPGNPASTDIKQTWKGAVQSQGANAQLRPGQVAGQTMGGAGVVAQVGGGLMAVGGIIGVAQSASGNEEHGWGNVLSGAMSGAATGAGVGMALNVVPVYGQLAYGITVASTTVAGALVGGSQMFSESGGDCARDPITNLYTCCNTTFNKGQRQVRVGGDMYCEFPGVRTCLQGGQEHETHWYDKDEWGACKTENVWCAGWDKPEAGPWSIQPFLMQGYSPDYSGKLCWQWECEEGWSRSGGKCVKNGSAGGGSLPDGSGAGDIDSLIAQLEATASQIRAECVK